MRQLAGLSSIFLPLFWPSIGPFMLLWPGPWFSPASSSFSKGCGRARKRQIGRSGLSAYRRYLEFRYLSSSFLCRGRSPGQQGW